MAGCRWVGPGNSFLSPQPTHYPWFRLLLTASCMLPSFSLRSQCALGRFITQSRSLSGQFQWSSGGTGLLSCKPSLSEGDRMRVEGLRPLGTSVSGTCLGLGCRVGRALFPAGQDSWHPLVSQGNAIYERDVYSCTCVHVMCVSRICPPRSLCPKGYPSSPLLQGSQCEHGHCFPGVLSLVRAETQFGITDLEY